MSHSARLFPVYRVAMTARWSLIGADMGAKIDRCQLCGMGSLHSGRVGRGTVPVEQSA